MSKKQQAFAHTAAAERAGFPTKEFDRASKGRGAIATTTKIKGKAKPPKGK